MAKDVEGRELVFRPNHHTEHVILAAAMVSPEYRRAAAPRHPPDRFLVPEHRPIWAAIREAVRRGLAADPATLHGLAPDGLDVSYLATLVQQRPDVPDAATLRHHEEQLAWDAQRLTALTGPISSLLEAIQKGELPDRVRALARATAECFDGWSDRKYLLARGEATRRMMEELRARHQGRMAYPYGISGLDLVDPQQDQEVKRRMIPGCAPGQITVITGTSGSGKSTLTARIVLGIARQKRRVLYGAWEMSSPVTLELLACMSLNMSRTSLMEGRYQETELLQLEERARQIEHWVQFMENPFRRRQGERPSNERNLDVVAGYIADSGADVFVGDLWKRCLVSDEPSDEEQALYRQQAIAEELRVHCLLVQQQRLKDVESRADKRPTREGIKGSGAWTEVADTMLGVHRPALWKPIEDNVIEVDVLKQRYGKWPLAVEFDWDADRGMISGGKSVPYEMSSGFGGETSNPIDLMIKSPQRKGRSR